MGVDKILNLMAPEDSRGIVFHVSHKPLLTRQPHKSNARLEFLGFPQIHSAHHNNKLYSFLISKISWRGDCCCGLLLPSFSGECEREKLCFPPISTARGHAADFILY